MENATYVGLSYQAALERQMNVVANNIANISTPGFKARGIMFREQLIDQEGNNQSYSQVVPYAEYMDTKSGDLQQTSRPLDVALEGPGYFGVVTGQGVQFTRAGHFALNSIGEIVTPEGLRVADEGGAAIALPAGVSDIKILEDGTIVADNNAVGRLMVRQFPDEQALEPVGNALFKAPPGQEGVAAENTRVRQGVIEGSNVNGVLESSSMIEIMRNYQSVQRMMQSENDRMRSAIQRLSGRGE